MASASSDDDNVSQSPTTDLGAKLESSLHTSNSGFWCWDPTKSYDWDRAGPPNVLCGHRIKKDMASIFKDPLPGIFVMPEESNMCQVHCLIIGPFDTPYEGGFFHFVVRFGPSYPLHPPRVKFLTTDMNRVRFNPNLYQSGKVCLSILGTWAGPKWSPASNLGSLLMSIQSLMNENPYHNEPGFEKERVTGDSATYNRIITHESLRVAVCQELQLILSNRSCFPSYFTPLIRSTFLDFYEHYVQVCEDNEHLDGQAINDPFKHNTGVYQFSCIKQKLQQIYEQISSQPLPSPTKSKSEAEDGDREEGESPSSKNPQEDSSISSCPLENINDPSWYLEDVATSDLSDEEES